MNDTMCSIPVFIGNFRSGTTLLANLLGFHEEIAPWFETKGLVEVLRWQRVLSEPGSLPFEATLAKPNPQEGFGLDQVAYRLESDLRETLARMKGHLNSGKAAHERYPMGHDYLLYDLEEGLELIAGWRLALEGAVDPLGLALANGDLIKRFGLLHAQKASKRLWVNKTPEMTRFGYELTEALGPTKRILMLRDGRDVVRSASRLGWADPLEIGSWWKGMIVESRQSGDTSPQYYLELKYEDLLRDPVTELDRVLCFLGLPGRAAEIVDRYWAALGVEAFSPIKTPSAERHATLQYLDVAFLEDLGYSI